MIGSFFKDVKIYFIIRALFSFSYLISIKLYTGILTPENYGLFSVIFFFLSLFSICSSSWIGSSMIRFNAEWQEKGLNVYDAVAATAGRHILIFSSILIVILLYFHYTSFFELSLGRILLCLSFYLGMSTFNILIAGFTAQRKVNVYSVYYIVQLCLGIALSLFFLHLVEKSPFSIIAGQMLSYVIVLFIAIMRKDLCFRRGAANLQIDKQLKTFGYPVLILNLLANLLIFSDQIILKVFNLIAPLGIYAANYSLVDKSITVIGSILSISYAPIFFKTAHDNGYQLAYRFFWRVLFIYVGLALLAMTSIYFLYDLVFQFFVGVEYQLFSIIPFIMLGSFFLNMSNIFSEILVLHKNTRTMAACYVLPLLVNIVLNILYVPKFGIMAAAINTLIAYLVLCVSMATVALWHMKMSKSEIS